MIVLSSCSGHPVLTYGGDSASYTSCVYDSQGTHDLQGSIFGSDFNEFCDGTYTLATGNVPSGCEVDRNTSPSTNLGSCSDLPDGSAPPAVAAATDADAH